MFNWAENPQKAGVIKNPFDVVIKDAKRNDDFEQSRSSASEIIIKKIIYEYNKYALKRKQPPAIRIMTPFVVLE